MKQIIWSMEHPRCKIPAFLTDHCPVAISNAKHRLQFAYLTVSSADTDLFTTSVNEIVDICVVLIPLK